VSRGGPTEWQWASTHRTLKLKQLNFVQLCSSRCDMSERPLWKRPIEQSLSNMLTPQSLCFNPHLPGEVWSGTCFLFQQSPALHSHCFSLSQLGVGHYNHSLCCWPLQQLGVVALLKGTLSWCCSGCQAEMTFFSHYLSQPADPKATFMCVCVCVCVCVWVCVCVCVCVCALTAGNTSVDAAFNLYAP